MPQVRTLSRRTASGRRFYRVQVTDAHGWVRHDRQYTTLGDALAFAGRFTTYAMHAGEWVPADRVRE